MIEAASRRQIVRQGAEVPLTHAHRLVAALLQHIGKSLLIRVQSVFCLRSEHARHTDPCGVSSGQQGRT